MLQFEYEPENQRSAVYDDGNLIGVCEYQIRGNQWLITHTEVLPQYGGQGIARKLVLMVAQAGEEAGAEIVPICSYAVKVLG